MSDKGAIWFPEFTFDVFIRLDRVLSSSLLCIFRICMTAGPLRASSGSSAILVQYSMLRFSACFFATFPHKYADRSRVLISISLMLGVTCGN